MASRSIVSLMAAAAASILAASAAEAFQDQQQAPEQQAPEPYGPPPIPPHAEGQAVAGAGGAYCYGGPHPVDTRVAGGDAWDETGGRHTHFYPPFDLRLFTLKDGCYYFIGDPSDFGYRGDVYRYYGAHPIHDHYGGNWCFMIGGHAHYWRPWSSLFITVGPWYYWHGPYDPFFWSYWPYYAFYYRSYYPHYYAGGRFHRGRDRHVAPPIGRVPTPRGWTGGGGNSGPGWRGTPPSGGMAGAAAAGASPVGAGTPSGRRSTDAAGHGWRGVPPSSGTGGVQAPGGRGSSVAVPTAPGVGRGSWSGTPPAAGSPAPPRSSGAWGPGTVGSPPPRGGGSFSAPRISPPRVSAPRLSPPAPSGAGPARAAPRTQGPSGGSGWRK